MAEDPPATPRRQHGHSRAYILDRLKRENLTDLAAAVEAGTVSAFAAAVQCGWTQRPPTLASVTHQARKRQVRLRAIEGELGPGEKMELIYGPSPAQGSLFRDRQHLVSAWAACRDELLERANPGRRPAGFYEFEWPDPHRPPYAEERSTLWRRGLLTETERITLEAEWKEAFVAAQPADFSLNDGSGEILMGDCARAAHYRHHDIPAALIRRWEAARRRRARAQVRTGAESTASSTASSSAESSAESEESQEKAPNAASDARGEEKSMSLRPEFNAAVGTLK